MFSCTEEEWMEMNAYSDGSHRRTQYTHDELFPTEFGVAPELIRWQINELIEQAEWDHDFNETRQHGLEFSFGIEDYQTGAFTIVSALGTTEKNPVNEAGVARAKKVMANDRREV